MATYKKNKTPKFFDKTKYLKRIKCKRKHHHFNIKTSDEFIVINTKILTN